MVCKIAHGTWKLWQQIAIYSDAQILYGRETSSLVPKPSRPESQLWKIQSCDLRLGRPGDEARKLLSHIELRPAKHTAHFTRLSVTMEMMYMYLCSRANMHTDKPRCTYTLTWRCALLSCDYTTWVDFSDGVFTWCVPTLLCISTVTPALISFLTVWR